MTNSVQLDDKQILILSALLHDIGKSFHRQFHDFEEESERSREFHNVLGGTFVNTYLNAFDEQTKHRIASLISNHHERGEKLPKIPQDAELLSILKIADRLSAEMRDLTKEQAKDFSNPENFHNLLIKELLGDKTEYNSLKFMPFSTFLSERVINHQTYREIISESEKSFKINLINLFNATAPENFENSIQSIRAFFKEYFFFLSSYSQGDEQNESLYTHTITTTAIASALYDDFKTTSTPVTDKDEARNRIHLALFKLSGLQQSIFSFLSKDYTGKFAGKITRGRSVKIGIITELAAKWIAESTGLSTANIISVVSGKAFFIIPESKVAQFKEACQKIDYSLLKNEYPLRASCGTITLSALEKTSAQPETTNKKSEKSNLNQLFNSAAKDLVSRAVQETETMSGEQCPICGSVKHDQDSALDSAIAKKLMHLEGESEDDKNGIIKACNKCKLAFYIGSETDNSKDYCISIGKQQETMHWYSVLGPDCPYKFAITEAPIENTYNVLNVEIRKLRKTFANFSELSKSCGLKIAARVNFRDEPFDELCLKKQTTYDEHQEKPESKKEKESTYLAALKSDYDNLGAKINNVVLNVSNLVEVNETFDGLNFSFLNQIMKEQGANKHPLYYLYAGGDDLFFFGRFDSVFWFYSHYIEKLAILPKLTFSSSILLFKKGFPLREVSTIAENGVKTAKKKKDKNSVYLSFVNVPKEIDKAIYNKEYLEVVKANDSLLLALSSDKISKHFLYSIYSLITKNKVRMTTKVKLIDKAFIKLKQDIQLNYKMNKNELSEQDIPNIRKIIMDSVEKPHILAMALLLNSELKTGGLRI